jgi:hypothetical protein
MTHTGFVASDVDKVQIPVALFESECGGTVEYFGRIANRSLRLRKARVTEGAITWPALRLRGGLQVFYGRRRQASEPIR